MSNTNNNGATMFDFDGTKRNSIALFDFDGTLFDGHVWQAMIRYSIAHRYRFPSALSYLASHSLLYPLNKSRLVSDEGFFTRWGKDLAFIVDGLGKEEVAKLFGLLIDQYVLNRLRPEVIKIMGNHQSRGQIVVLVSGAFRELLEITGRRLGVFHVVGTKLEIIDGIYTGKIINPLCFGVNKVILFKEFMESIRIEIDLNSSFAYANSIDDTPMLEMVGNPVVVYPDRKLRQIALQKGWKLLNM